MPYRFAAHNILTDLGSSTFEIQGEQSGQKLVIAQIKRPAVGSEDSFIEPLMGQVEPCGPFIVKIRQRPFRQLGSAGFNRPAVSTRTRLPDAASVLAVAIASRSDVPECDTASDAVVIGEVQHQGQWQTT